MPTNRGKRMRGRAPGISADVVNFLETGTGRGPEIFRMKADNKKLIEAWEECQEEVLANWENRRPCERPWAFWQLHSDHRRQLTGPGNGPYSLIDEEGLPLYFQYQWIDYPGQITFESSATFLKRNGLLTPYEERYLTKHLKLREPEVIEKEVTSANK